VENFKVSKAELVDWSTIMESKKSFTLLTADGNSVPIREEVLKKFRMVKTMLEVGEDMEDGAVIHLPTLGFKELGYMVRCARSGLNANLTDELAALTRENFFKLFEAVNYVDFPEMFEYLKTEIQGKLLRKPFPIRGLPADVLAAILMPLCPDVRNHCRFVDVCDKFAEVLNARTKLTLNLGPDLEEIHFLSIRKLHQLEELKVLSDQGDFGSFNETLSIVKAVQSLTKARIIVDVFDGNIGKWDEVKKDFKANVQINHLRPAASISNRYDMDIITTVTMDDNKKLLFTKNLSLVSEAVFCFERALTYEETLHGLDVVGPFPKITQIDILDFPLIETDYDLKELKPISLDVLVIKCRVTFRPHFARCLAKCFPNAETVSIAMLGPCLEPPVLSFPRLRRLELVYGKMTPTFAAQLLPQNPTLEEISATSHTYGTFEKSTICAIVSSMLGSWSSIRIHFMGKITFIDRDFSRKITFGRLYDGASLVNVIPFFLKKFPEIKTVSFDAFREKDLFPMLTRLSGKLTGTEIYFRGPPISDSDVPVDKEVQFEFEGNIFHMIT
jgi:hypothetical protein